MGPGRGYSRAPVLLFGTAGKMCSLLGEEAEKTDCHRSTAWKI